MAHADYNQQVALTCDGEIDEWHVVLCKSFQDIAFGLVPRFLKVRVSFVSAFFLSGFKPIGSIGDAMSCDGVE